MLRPEDDRDAQPCERRLTSFANGELPAGGGDRLWWLDSDPDGFTPGTYRRLADHHTAHGDERAARAVELAIQRWRTRALPAADPGFGPVLEGVVGYSYRVVAGRGSGWWR